MTVEKFVYAGFTFIVHRDEKGNFAQLTPEPGQHLASWKDRHRRAAESAFRDQWRGIATISDAERETALRATLPVSNMPAWESNSAFLLRRLDATLRQLDAARTEIAEWERIMRSAERVLVGQVKLAETRAEVAEARVAVLEAALRPFAIYAERIAVDHPGWDHDGYSFRLHSQLASEHGPTMTMRSFREARAALAKDPPR